MAMTSYPVLLLSSPEEVLEAMATDAEIPLYYHPDFVRGPEFPTNEEMQKAMRNFMRDLRLVTSECLSGKPSRHAVGELRRMSNELRILANLAFNEGFSVGSIQISAEMLSGTSEDDKLSVAGEDDQPNKET